jgi:phosphoribosyl 1,2-cyclic phosphate phosphodiesterase
MVEIDGKRIVIDAGPDFRYQMLRTGARHLDAILLTHEHKDHTGGIDDVRAFNFVDFPVIHQIDIYATARTAACVRKDFDYAFAQNKYRGVPEMRLHETDPSESFEVKGQKIIPIRGKHSERFDITGYRIGNMAYMTDFKQLCNGEIEKLKGVDTLIINALRFASHYSHFNVEEAMAIIEQVAPRQAYLTHMSHEIGLYAKTNPALPKGVALAYDGLTIEI